MKKVAVVVISVMILSTSLLAGENRKGFYVGAGYGNATLDDGGLYEDPYIGLGEVESDTNGMKVYAGYQFNNVIALEMGYTNFGKYESKSATNDFSMSPIAVNIAANLGYSFMDSQIRPFVNLGFAYVNNNHENLPNTVIELNDAAGAFHYGLGIAYEPNALKGLGFRLALEKDMYLTQVTGGASDETYTQVLSLMYAGVQYKF